MSGEGLAWVDAGGGYELALDGHAVVARNARGRVLASVPAALRDGATLRRLRELRGWLEGHDRECAAVVETWMLRSLPVPLAVLEAVWPDPAWRRPLRDAVVAALDESGRPSREATGFLRAVEPERGLGLVTRDGETAWRRPTACAVPHPVLLPDLEDFLDFARELRLEQAIPQLYRETFVRPPDLAPAATAVTAFSGARFDQPLQLVGRCRSLGYQVSGGQALTRVWEAGAMVEARYWIGAGRGEAEAVTGDLCWLDPAGQRLRLAGVGPVAYSEGMRMAAAISAGRTGDEWEES